MRITNRQNNKLVDTSLVVSKGGRVDKYWSSEGFELHFKKYFPYLEESPKELIEYIINGDIIGVLKRYQIAGLEFGNWINQDLRYNFFGGLCLSLEDLNKVLKFNRNLGFNHLKIGYGSRGWGGRASAHYEPWTETINLTKPSGLGSLAHEYGHYLDFFFGAFIDQNKISANLVGYSKSDNPFTKGSLRYLAIELLHKIKFNADGSKSAYLNRIAELGEYYNRNEEIFARVFEQYIGYKLNEIKRPNYFLAKRKYEASVYLKGSELDAVIPYMDALITEMRFKVLSKK